MLNSDSPVYSTWKTMRKRCRDKNHRTYIDYGAKGIGICKEWDNFKTFELDMGPRPTTKHTLDRIDNTKGYSKENCRWATRLEQTSNRKTAKHCLKGHAWTAKNTVWTHNGKYKTRRCRICIRPLSPETTTGEEKK